MRTMARLPLFVTLISCGTAVQAAEWEIDPLLRFRTSYNDNVRLSTDNVLSSAEATFSPSAVFSVETPTSGISGNMSFDFRRFESDSDLDNNASRLDIKSFRKLERSRLELNLGVIKDTTLDSQLEETGVVFDRVQRQRITASPNWSYTFNERTSARASYSYSDVEYKNADVRFVNFTQNSAQMSLSRVMNEKTTATLTLSGSQSDNDNDVGSITTNIQAGASYRFSRTLSASLFVGTSRTETTLSNSRVLFLSGNNVLGETRRDVTNNSSNSTFNASITKIFLRGKVDLFASRNVSNNLNGQPIEVTRLSSTNLYRISAALSASLKLNLYSSESGSNVSNLNREYYQIDPGLTWKLKKFWSLSGSYRYRRQTFGDINDDATQNAAYLTLTYRWPRIAVSR